jgi:osmotically inducible lipoprotein OsmB
VKAFPPTLRGCAVAGGATIKLTRSHAIAVSLNQFIDIPLDRQQRCPRCARQVEPEAARRCARVGRCRLLYVFARPSSRFAFVGESRAAPSPPATTNVPTTITPLAGSDSWACVVRTTSDRQGLSYSAIQPALESRSEISLQKVAVILLMCLAATACANRQQATGTAVGAGTGLLVAGPVGAVVGAGVGAVVAAPGGVVDKVERRR